MTPTTIMTDESLIVDKYSTILKNACHTFGSGLFKVAIIPRQNIEWLAEYIQAVLGEYHYYTVKNRCYVTLNEAIRNKYLYIKEGKPRQMSPEALYEWIFFHEKVDEMDDAEVLAELKTKYLASTNVYPFFKVDAVPVNIKRRMTRGSNTPESFLSKNIKGLHKDKNGHLQGEEDETRRLMFNTFVALKKLWVMGYTPLVAISESRIQLSTPEQEQNHSSSAERSQEAK